MNTETHDPIEQLHHDHLHLNRLVDDVRVQLNEYLRDEGNVEELFGTVEEFLAAASEELFEHFDAEESGLFPYVMEKLPSMKAKIRSLESGHDKICGTLTRMKRFIGNGGPAAFAQDFDAFVALFARFDANYSKHAIEEQAMLTSLMSTLGDDARAEISRLLAEI